MPSVVKSPVHLFADDTKLYRRVTILKDHKALQDDLTNLEDWSTKWNMCFNTNRCKVMHIGHSNPQHEYNSVLPRPFLQGGTPCPFQEAEMTPCRLLVTPRDALLYFTWPRTSRSAVIGAETMRFPYFGIRHRNPTHM